MTLCPATVKICGVLNSPEHFPSLTWAGGLRFELCCSNNTKGRDVMSRPLQGLYFGFVAGVIFNVQ